MTNTLDKNPANQFWKDSATALITLTAQKLNLSPEHPEQGQNLLAAIERDDLFPDKTKEMEGIIAAEGSWSRGGSFEEMYPFTNPAARASIVATAAQILAHSSDKHPSPSTVL